MTDPNSVRTETAAQARAGFHWFWRLVAAHPREAAVIMLVQAAALLLSIFVF